jgi:hypothetical protein
LNDYIKHTSSTDFSRFFHHYIKHTNRFDRLQQVYFALKLHSAMDVFDIVMEKPAEVSRSDECVWYSHGKTCWSQSRRWVCFFPWLYQTYPSPRLTSAGFSMTMSSTHLFNSLQQIFPWLCQAHTSSTDFSRVSHDYVKHTSLHSRSDGCVWNSHGKTLWSQLRRWVC